MRLALFQPDIPQNLGAAIRTAACFGAAVDVVEPCAFPLTDKGIRRAAMDYVELVEVVRHGGWRSFLDSPQRRSGRLVLFSTQAQENLWDFAFAPSDIILVGRESAGVPPDVAAVCDAAVRVPIAAGTRSLNVVVAAGIGLAAAARRTGALDAT